MRGIEQIPWLYDGFMALVEATGLGRWRRRLIGGARGRVLEVGCGTGRNLPLYGDVERLVAFDPCLEVALRARRRAAESRDAEEPARVLVADAQALPFRDDAFDTVVSSLVFCSVPDPDRGLREVDRVLAPDGELRMLEHVRYEAPWKARIQDWVQPSWTWLTGGCHPNRETEATVERNGFRIDRETRRAKADMRLFVARRDSSQSPGP